MYATFVSQTLTWCKQLPWAQIKRRKGRQNHNRQSQRHLSDFAASQPLPLTSSHEGVKRVRRSKSASLDCYPEELVWRDTGSYLTHNPKVKADLLHVLEKKVGVAQDELPNCTCEYYDFNYKYAQDIYSLSFQYNNMISLRSKQIHMCMISIHHFLNFIHFLWSHNQ